MHSGENTKGITGQLVHKEITHRFNHPSQLKPGIEMGVIPAEVLPVGAKGIKWSKIKVDCWTSGILHDGTVELSDCTHALSFKKMEE